MTAEVSVADSEEWLTPAETAALTKLSVGTLANHRYLGIGIPFTKITPGRGGRIRYRRSDVERWLTGGDGRGRAGGAVSARDELIKLIAGGSSCGGHYNCGPLAEDLRDAAEELDAFVHELAEKQRAWQAAYETAELAKHGSLDHETILQGNAVRAAADLIDPKVKQ
jgi:hypothetical protein